jgi:hypothetical protein
VIRLAPSERANFEADATLQSALLTSPNRPFPRRSFAGLSRVPQIEAPADCGRSALSADEVCAVRGRFDTPIRPRVRFLLLNDACVTRQSSAEPEKICPENVANPVLDLEQRRDTRLDWKVFLCKRFRGFLNILDKRRYS